MVQVPLPVVPSWVPFRTLTVLGAVTLSLLVVLLTDDSDDGSLAHLRRRLVLGVPWGTVISILGVLCVYLFVQGAFDDLRDPLVIPFRSWSYFYPLGMLTAAFSHASLGHITGNLVGTAMFAPIVEYAWGHYPQRRGTQTFTSPLTNPIVRILLVPFVVFFVGLFTAAFALGPVIGFSGVVFAFAGFSIVNRPLTAVLAILADRVLGLVITAIQNPRVVTVPRPRVITPWWANVAIQGHAIGILSGILLGFAFVYYRDRWPDPKRVWFGLLAFATIQGLWALFVPQGNGRFVMFRWAGTALVFVLATVIVLATTGEYDIDIPEFEFSSALRTTALVVVVVLTAAIAGSAIPYNVAQFANADAPGPNVEVRDYAVSYGENVPDGYVNSISVPLVDDLTDINTSGVIVTSDRRQIWQTVVLESQLKNRGFATVELGGVGWERDVHVNRSGWKPTGNDSVYKVYLRPTGADRTLAFTSESRRAGVVLGGRNVTLAPVERGFRFRVSMANRTLGTAPIPGYGRTTSAGQINFTRNGSQILASYDRTRVEIAKRTGTPNN